MEYEYEIDLFDLIRQVAKRWYVILLLTVLCAVFGFQYAKMNYVPSYKVVTDLVVTQKKLVQEDIDRELLEQAGKEDDDLLSRQLSILQKEQDEEKKQHDMVYQRITENAEQLLISDAAMQVIIDDQGLSETPNELRRHISIKRDDDGQRYSSVFQITVSGSNQEQTQQISNAFCSNAADILQIGEELDVINSTVLSSNSSASTMNKSLPLQAAILGFVVAVALQLLQIMPGNRVRTESQIVRTLKLPILVAVPWIKEKFSRKGNAENMAAQAIEVPQKYSEAFKMLRTKVKIQLSDKPCHTIAVTSAVAGEGKSCVSVELAKALAESGSRVLLMDCNLRSPSLQNYLNLNAQKGLSEVLNGVQASDAVIHVDQLNIDVMTAGAAVQNPSELLDSEQMQKQLLQDLSGQYEYIILDTPAAAVLTDALLISRCTDHVLLVLRQDAAKMKQAIQAKNNLEQVNANILGVVFNGCDTTVAKDKEAYYTNKK